MAAIGQDRRVLEVPGSSVRMSVSAFADRKVDGIGSSTGGFSGKLTVTGQ
jgi:hypothetical protein